MSEPKTESPFTFFSCGPASGKCECSDGPCEHVWDGPTNRTENSESAS